MEKMWDHMDLYESAESTAIMGSRFVATEQIEPPVGVVTQCDIAEGVPAIASPRVRVRALVLVRMFSEPIGMLSEHLPADSMDPSNLARAIVRNFGSRLRERFADCGLAWDGQLPTGGLRPRQTPSFLTSRERVLREGPQMTVAVCTRDRPEGLAVLLASLGAQDYQRMRVLVVDNAPSDDRTRQVVLTAARKHLFDIDYVIEPRPGLSWARNRAIDVSNGEVIAWADDGERCDRWWATELARGFVEVPEASAVTGIMVPGELATKSRAWFEDYSGVRRGRGFTRAVFSPATARRQSPLYPLPPFGAGGNMAFRRDALRQIGGFDCALGAGTVTCCGEDTAAPSMVLLAGGTIVYQPSAIVHHYHRRDYDELQCHLQGYGRGLTSFYTSMLMRRAGGTAQLLRLGGQAVRDHFTRRGRQLTEFSDDFPRELLWANRIGLLQGPFMYAVARVHTRRLRCTSRGR
jgi:glycosyltransferase involved in cell wall biosynthesis